MPMSRSLTVAAATASTTQTQAGGTVLNADVTIATVGNASDAFTIPANLPAGTVFYIRGGANAGLIYPPTGGNINAKGADASEAIAATVLHVGVVLTSGSSSTYRFDKCVAPS